jgi:hypothetical protein
MPACSLDGERNSMRSILIAAALALAACQPKAEEAPPPIAQPEPIEATHAYQPPAGEENIGGITVTETVTPPPTDVKTGAPTRPATVSLTIVSDEGYELTAEEVGVLTGDETAITKPGVAAPLSTVLPVREEYPLRHFSVTAEGGSPDAPRLCGAKATVSLILYQRAGGIKLAGFTGAKPGEPGATLCDVFDYAPE